MEANLNVPLLVVTPARKSDESLSGFLLRLSDVNAYCSHKAVLNLIGHDGHDVALGFPSLSADFKLAKSIEAVCGSTDGAATENLWRKMESAAGPYFNFHGAPLPLDAFMTKHAQVCPRCLKLSNYVREEWELSAVTVCPIHHVDLVDRCPNCNLLLKTTRVPIPQCSECHFDLTTSPVRSCEPEEATLADFVAAAAPFRLMAGVVTCIEEAESLFATIQTMAFSTAEVLECNWKSSYFSRLDISARKLATSTVARAITGKTIDGIALHHVLLQHVEHRFAYLPRKIALTPLVDFLLANEFLSPRSRAILATGSDGPLYSPAFSIFDGRPPSLENEEQLAEFLRCNQAAVCWLMKSGVISQPQFDHGFDADQVLVAQERLSRFVSLDDMDRRFGVPGMTKALIDWHVIPMSTSPRDSWMAIDLAHVAQLLDKLLVLSIGSLNATDANLVSLNETRLANCNFTEALVTVIARALRLDMEGLAWRTPFSFGDIFIAKADAGVSGFLCVKRIGY